MRLALAQFDFPVGAIAANAEKILTLCAEARDTHQAQLIVFPELALTGYPPEDLLHRADFLREAEAALHALAEQITGITAVIGHPQALGSAVYNAASVVRDGRIEQTYRKRRLPNYAVFDEQRYFRTGEQPCVFDVDGVTVGLVVCEDLWFQKPYAETCELGAQLVVSPNASPYEAGKFAARDQLLETRVGEGGVPIAYLNTVGGQDELIFDGASVLIDGDGSLHPAAEAFDDLLLVADFDAERGAFSRIVWDDETEETAESLNYRAVVRATRDYVHKNGFKKAWLGLSGGIDSALTLAVAVDALGAEHVTAVRLPSKFTSDLSNDLAQEQADMLGVRLETVSIKAPVGGFTETLSELFAGTEPSLAEENIQARARGVIMMALSNKFGGLLLTTGNKSEYAVGYSTLYGDMNGAFAPIKDLYKQEVYALSRFRNQRSPAIPEAVITRPPSAELRDNQTDQDSLPPYDVLDGILLRFVDQELSAEAIIAEGFDADTVHRIIKLVLRSEYKRRQSAPGVKVSGRAFGRERRYPMTSGWKPWV